MIKEKINSIRGKITTFKHRIAKNTPTKQFKYKGVKVARIEATQEELNRARELAIKHLLYKTMVYETKLWYWE